MNKDDFDKALIEARKNYFAQQTRDGIITIVIMVVLYWMFV